MNWTLMTMMQLSVKRADGRGLTIAASPIDGRWALAAVETSVRKTVDEAERGGLEEGMQAVFDDHGHQVLPEQPSLAEAIAVAEKYARKWKRLRAAPQTCDCDELERASLPPVAPPLRDRREPAAMNRPHGNRPERP